MLVFGTFNDGIVRFVLTCSLTMLEIIVFLLVMHLISRGSSLFCFFILGLLSELCSTISTHLFWLILVQSNSILPSVTPQ